MPVAVEHTLAAEIAIPAESSIPAGTSIAGESSAGAGSLRELLRIAVPLILSSGSLSLMNVADRVFLTWYSTDAMAASLPSGLLHWTLMSVAMGTAGYVSAFVAQYEGAGRKERVAAAVWQGVYLSLLAGALILLFVPLAGPLFSWIGHPTSVRRLEVEYFSVLCAGSAPIVLATALAGFYSGRGKTLIVMGVTLGKAAINIGLDYCLIFGAGPFPQWGIAGAAVATVVAHTVAVAIYAGLMLRPREAAEYHVWRHRRFDFPLFKRLLYYGLPNGLSFLVDIGGFSVFILVIGLLGQQQLAATSLAFNLNSLAFVPMLGLGTAVMVLVAQRVGEGRPALAVQTTRTAFFLGGTWMLAFAAVYIFLPGPILALYAAGSSPEEFAALRDEVTVLLRFVAVYSFFDAMGIVFGSALRGAGDTRFSLIFSFLTAWLLMVLPVAVAWQMGRNSLMLAWTACTVYIIVVGVGFLLRFQWGPWQSMRVIEAAGESSVNLEE